MFRREEVTTIRKKGSCVASLLHRHDQLVHDVVLAFGRVLALFLLLVEMILAVLQLRGAQRDRPR